MDWAQAFHDIGLAIAGGLVGGYFSVRNERARSKSDAAKELAKDRRERIWQIGVDFIEVSDEALACLYRYREQLQTGKPQLVPGSLGVGEILNRLSKMQAKAAFLRLEAAPKIKVYLDTFVQALLEIEMSKELMRGQREMDKFEPLAKEIVDLIGAAHA